MTDIRNICRARKILNQTLTPALLASGYSDTGNDNAITTFMVFR